MSTPASQLPLLLLTKPYLFLAILVVSIRTGNLNFHNDLRALFVVWLSYLSQHVFFPRDFVYRFHCILQPSSKVKVTGKE